MQLKLLKKLTSETSKLQEEILNGTEVLSWDFFTNERRGRRSVQEMAEEGYLTLNGEMNDVCTIGSDK